MVAGRIVLCSSTLWSYSVTFFPVILPKGSRQRCPFFLLYGIMIWFVLLDHHIEAAQYHGHGRSGDLSEGRAWPPGQSLKDAQSSQRLVPTCLGKAPWSGIRQALCLAVAPASWLANVVSDLNHASASEKSHASLPSVRCVIVFFSFLDFNKHIVPPSYPDVFPLKSCTSH